MNLIKIYGDLKYQLAITECHHHHFGGTTKDYEDILKHKRLIQIIEYKIGLITQDDMDSSLFNLQEEKNDWLLYTFTENYQRNNTCHYYRKCYKCGYKWYSRHSRYEQEKRSCGCK